MSNNKTVTQFKKVWPVADHCNDASLELDHAAGVLNLFTEVVQAGAHENLTNGQLIAALYSVLTSVERAQEFINKSAGEKARAAP